MPRKIKFGFVGMNLEALKAHNIPGNLPYGEAIVWRSKRHTKADLDTLEHEMVERHLMRYYKPIRSIKDPEERYRKAHRIALKYEGTRMTPKQVVSELRRHP